MQNPSLVSRLDHSGNMEIIKKGMTKDKVKATCLPIRGKSFALFCLTEKAEKGKSLSL